MSLYINVQVRRDARALIGWQTKCQPNIVFKWACWCCLDVLWCLFTECILSVFPNLQATPHTC